MSGHLRVVDGLAAADVPTDPVAFLRALAGPSAIRVKGVDSSRCRVLVTLLHGNEPSGLRAVHGWLRIGAPPATDVLIVLGAVDAALREPVLTSRALPDGSDLNRSFGPSAATKTAGARAQAIVDLITAARPEALVDIHNNTGHNPAYGVAARVGDLERQLVGLFADRVVHYNLRVGALLEATVDVCPTVVIEVGRVGDAAADAVARSGLDRLLDATHVVGTEVVVPAVGVLHTPVRVEAAAGVTIAVAEAPVPDVHLTVAANVDRHNFERLEPGTVIGWIAAGTAWPLHARGADGLDRSHELFAAIDGRLVTKRPLTPIMITTDPVIARSDCLFYIVEQAVADGA